MIKVYKKKIKIQWVLIGMVSLIKSLVNILKTLNKLFYQKMKILFILLVKKILLNGI